MSYRSYQSLTGNSFQINKPTQFTNYHSFFTFNSACQRWSIALLVLPFHAKPNLAVSALTIPAKVAVRNSIYREKLKATQQAILLWNVYLLAEYFN